MSDSEGETAFASADEGEEDAKKNASKKVSKPAAGSKAKEGVGTFVRGKDGDATTTSAACKSDEGKKKQQQNNKKGKGGQQPIKKEDSQNPKSSITNLSSPSKESSPKDTSSESHEGKVKDKPSTREARVEVKKEVERKGHVKAAPNPAATSVSTKSGENFEQKVEQSKPGSKSEAVISQPEPEKETSSSQSQKVKQMSENISPKLEQEKQVPAGEPIQTTATTAEKPASEVRKNLQSGIAMPEGQNIPRSEQDHTTQQDEVLKKLEESAKQSSGGGWGWSSWGSSLLSAATNSVQTFTSQVGDGFSTIIETVESSLGVPDPAKAQDQTESTPASDEPHTVISQLKEDKASPDVKENESCSQEEQGDSREESSEEKVKEERQDEGSSSWFSSWGISDLAKKVQDKGKSLASKGQNLMSEGFDAVENFAAGGIDVLENLGKKTYNTLTEHDPGFRKTREFLNPKGSKPNLSSVLREAKDQAEREAEQAKENEEARKAHFGTLFDDYQGIAHLEALEILSNQSEKKVHSLLNSLSSQDLAQIKPTLIAIKEAFEINEDEEEDAPKDQDFSSLVGQYLSELALGTAPDKLNKVHEMVKQWIVDFDSHESHELGSIKEVHQKSIQALAELTAKGVEQFHKAGELVLLEKGKDKDCTERAKSLARLTGVLCHEIGNLASKFSECLNKMANEKEKTDEITPLVTNVYLEASNSSTYIQDAFQLLLPVLQHAALEHAIVSRHS